ncbi:MAG TPA: hypothetical protein VLC09_02770 [Polyangiaceae bacterium]|nr:hypothetical protein [Polyangiaceae bacterium]
MTWLLAYLALTCTAVACGNTAAEDTGETDTGEGPGGRARDGAVDQPEVSDDGGAYSHIDIFIDEPEVGAQADARVSFAFDAAITTPGYELAPGVMGFCPVRPATAEEWSSSLRLILDPAGAVERAGASRVAFTTSAESGIAPAFALERASGDVRCDPGYFGDQEVAFDGSSAYCTVDAGVDPSDPITALRFDFVVPVYEGVPCVLELRVLGAP